ncbi:5-formyltetrahydrofolate cyclo-ligase [Proteiniborus sp. MB09-C3]|uniref:5-formyltetrahydrofolate cyclo-ligase n=1 Tax=Proteiniborus sp. MB09-C3 TaxID=3050072 RepID=UPI002554040D|nr:5-formyltetrahydrofolate cyclo-ligase [Proteiniborus sp. MB09-C3]WIV13471.1 5-formyltetrahydrofolate cyclo-ligase [Proteiniborus sp. MB09-C3]
MDKKSLRSEILSKRKSLSKEELIEKSTAISKLLFSTDKYKSSNYIMCYIDFRNEVKTEEIIKTSLKEGKNIIIPISVVETRQLILSQLLDYDKELEAGTYGILEPKKEFIREVNPELIDLVLMPGVAFDRRGYRIGYGGGYYDRFLTRIHKSVPKIALAFELQMVPHVREGRYDVPVDYIITENEIIKASE